MMLIFKISGMERNSSEWEVGRTDEVEDAIPKANGFRSLSQKLVL